MYASLSDKEGDACSFALIPSNSNSAQKTKSAATAAVMRLLPRGLRVALGRRSETFRYARIAELHRQVSRLVPAEAFKALGGIDQKPTDEILAWLPLDEKARKKAEKENERDKDPYPFVRLQDAQIEAWADRLNKAAGALYEWLEVIEGIEGKEAAAVRLYLGLIHGFTFNKGRKFHFEEHIRDTEAALKGIGHLEYSIQFLEKERGPESLEVLFLRYLLAKYCNNAASAFSNMSFGLSFGVNLSETPPEREFDFFIEKSRYNLERINHVVADRANDEGFDSSKELYFRSTYEEVNRNHILRRVSNFRTPLYSREEGVKKLEEVLFAILRLAPEAWVNRELKDQHGFLAHLFPHIRYFYFGTSGYEILQDLDMKMRTHSRDSFIAELKRAGFRFQSPHDRLRIWQ